jgi:hypothetical protein
MLWISTIEPSPYLIEGFDLEPLRFGHCLLMERFDEGKPEGQMPTPLELWRWLNICSRSHKNARRWLTKDLSKSFSLSRWAFVRTMRDHERFLAALSNWSDYMHENTATPPTLNPVASGGSESGVPRLQWLWNTAITQLNYNPLELCEAQFGQLVWSVLAMSDQNGGVRIIDDKLQKVFEDLKCQSLA